MSLIYISAFSLFNRTASRYLFNVFYFIGAVFIMFLATQSIRINRLIQWVYDRGVLRFAMLTWFFFILIHLGNFLTRDPFPPYDRTPHHSPKKYVTH